MSHIFQGGRDLPPVAADRPASGAGTASCDRMEAAACGSLPGGHRTMCGRRAVLAQCAGVQTPTARPGACGRLQDRRHRRASAGSVAGTAAGRIPDRQACRARPCTRRLRAPPTALLPGIRCRPARRLIVRWTGCGWVVGEGAVPMLSACRRRPLAGVDCWTGRMPAVLVPCTADGPPPAGGSPSDRPLLSCGRLPPRHRTPSSRLCLATL